MMKVEKGKKYRLNHDSNYFEKKYGEARPIVEIEDEDVNLWEGGWMRNQGVIACRLFGMRAFSDGYVIGLQRVYYGKVKRMGECVAEGELEEI
jgi:hypothetical protein